MRIKFFALFCFLISSSAFADCFIHEEVVLDESIKDVGNKCYTTIVPVACGDGRDNFDAYKSCSRVTSFV